jgi:hypothetical protein
VGVRKQEKGRALLPIFVRTARGKAWVRKNL